MDLHEVLGQISRSAVWIPDWAIAGAAFIVAAILALLVHGAIMRMVRRLLPASFEYGCTLVDRTHTLTRVGLVVVALAIVLPALPIGEHRPDRHGAAVGRLHRSGGAGPREARGERQGEQAMGRAGGQLQVVDSNERAVQLRALVSARTSPQGWDLPARCASS
jgi:hypothetical protein